MYNYLITITEEYYNDSLMFDLIDFLTANLDYRVDLNIESKELTLTTNDTKQEVIEYLDYELLYHYAYKEGILKIDKVIHIK